MVCLDSDGPPQHLYRTVPEPVLEHCQVYPKVLGFRAVDLCQFALTMCFERAVVNMMLYEQPRKTFKLS